MARRTFLKKLIKWFILVLSVAGLSILALFTFPARIRKKELKFFYVSDDDALPLRGVRQVFLEYTLRGRSVSSRVFIVNTGGELFALSPVCTHLGCLVT